MITGKLVIMNQLPSITILGMTQTSPQHAKKPTFRKQVASLVQELSPAAESFKRLDEAGRQEVGEGCCLKSGSIPSEISSCHQDHLEPAPTRL